MKGSDRYFVDGVSCRMDGQVLPVANLSVGGFFVACDRAPQRGAVLEFELALGERTPFRVVGQITWVNDPARPQARDLPQGFGIKVLRIAFPDKLAILDVLKRSSPGSLRRNRTAPGA